MPCYRVYLYEFLPLDYFSLFFLGEIKYFLPSNPVLGPPFPNTLLIFLSPTPVIPLSVKEQLLVLNMHPVSMTYFAYMSLYLRIKWFQTVVTNIKIKWQFSLSNAGKLFLSVLREHLCENEHLNWDLNANKSSMGRAQRECIPDILCERTNNINSSKKNLWVYVCVCVYISPYIYIYQKPHISKIYGDIYIPLIQVLSIYYMSTIL